MNSSSHGLIRAISIRCVRLEEAQILGPCHLVWQAFVFGRILGSISGDI